MANNTGNPIGSTAAKDLSDNAQNLDKFANGNDYEYADRLGRSRKSLKWIEDAALAIPAIDAAVRSEQQAERALSAKSDAEAARDAAQLSSGVYIDAATGLASTSSGKFFSVPSPESTEYLILYQNNAGAAKEVDRYPSAAAITTVTDRLTSTSAVGLAGAPVDGSYYNASTRVFAEPVTEKGVIRKIRVFSGTGTHTLKVRRFTSSGTGPLKVGHVLTQVSTDQVITYTGAGAQELVVDIPVNKGEFIGFYATMLSYSYVATFPIAAFAVAATFGDYTTLTVSALPAGEALQIGFDVAYDYVNAQRVKTIEAGVSQLKIASDAIADIPSKLSVTTKVGLPGTPAPGTYLSLNTRVFADRITAPGVLRKVRVYAKDNNQTLTIRRFTAPGSGPLKSGDVLTQVGSDVTVSYSGESVKEIDINIPVNAGEFIGVYGSSSSYAAINNDLGPAYGTGSSPGNYTSFTINSTAKSYSLQLSFDLLSDYVNTQRVKTIEEDVSQLQAANVVVANIALLPKAVAGAQRVVTGDPMGPVWYDGFVWRWTRDNSIVPNLGMRLLDLARRDGWLSLYDVSHEATVTTFTSGNVQYISGIKDGLNGSPDALQTVDGKHPVLSPTGLGGKASAKFSGVEHLHIAGTRKLSQPYFLLSVANFTGQTDVAGSSGKFLFDGLSPDRAAIIGSDAPGGNIHGWAGYAVEGTPLSSEPVVFGTQFDGERSESWVNGLSYNISTTTASGLTLGKVGADWNNGRNWIGNLAALLVYEGVLSRAKLARMQDLLLELYGISKSPLSLTAQGASVVRLSDMQTLYEKNPSTVIHVASVTKAMTALVLDRWVSNLSQTVTVVATDVIFADQTSFVQAGDVISYIDLMRSALMPSDNNASTAISRCVGQLINPAAATPAAAKAAFVAEMNTVAAELGMTSTTYSNAYEGCLTTATDLPKLLAHINTSAPRVVAAGGLMRYSAQVTGTNPRTLSFDHTINANKAPGFLFGKTGSGYGFGSVVIICERDGIKYAASILRADGTSDRVTEARRMMDVAVGASQ